MPFIRRDDWWIRGFDYPRLQLTFLLALSSALWIYSHQDGDPMNWVVGIVLSLSALYQFYRIVPYTRIWKKESEDAQYGHAPESNLKILVSNVLQTNQKTEKLFSLIREYDPDIILTLESNQWWQDQLDSVLEGDYPHSIKIPLENLYGMHLYSKYSLRESKVTYRIKDDIPGIDATINLPNGKPVQLYCIHPMPPSPTEAYASTGRDAELALIGKEVKDKNETVVVFGDLNDVAWSHSTRLFRRISGLSDPRVGRGLFPTYNAKYRLMRWPLDHVFHSFDLKVVRIERLDFIGSDHFPIFIELSLEPDQEEAVQSTSDKEDMEEANETISIAKNGEEHTVF